MQQTPYIFTQVVGLLPRDKFERIVNKYNGNAYIKKFTCWNQLLAMLWAQFTSRRSLRDIETSLRCHKEKLYRMGIGVNISRNTLAHANATRNVAIYRELAEIMMAEVSKIAIRDLELKKISQQFKVSGFFAIDSSTVYLNLKQFPWTVPQENRGGIKIHTMYDLLRNVPALCLVTGHEERDQTFMEDYPYNKGCIYVFDKAYIKASGMLQISKNEAYYVVRRKKKMNYNIIEEFPLSDDVNLLSDKRIRFSNRWMYKRYKEELRLVSYYSESKQCVMGGSINSIFHQRVLRTSLRLPLM